MSDPFLIEPCPFDYRLARTPYLVLPKLALQVMPMEWRKRFEAMLVEMEDAGLETPTITSFVMMGPASPTHGRASSTKAPDSFASSEASLILGQTTGTIRFAR